MSMDAPGKTVEYPAFEENSWNSWVFFFCHKSFFIFSEKNRGISEKKKHSYVIFLG